MNLTTTINLAMENAVDTAIEAMDEAFSVGTAIDYSILRPILTEFAETILYLREAKVKEDDH